MNDERYILPFREKIMEYKEIAKYEYKAPSYELKQRPDPAINYTEHANKRRFYFDGREGIYKSVAGVKDTVTMLFGGDLLCQDRMLEKFSTEEGGFDFSLCFEYIKPLLKSADFVAANLETSIAHTAPYRGEIISHEGPFFCNAPIQYLEAISDAGFDMLTTENNHTLDAGARGVAETIENIHRFGMIQTGTSLNETDKSLLIDVCGFKIGFAAFGGGTYNSMQQNLTPEGKEILLNTYSYEKAERIYRALKAQGAEYVICFPHWGKEYTDVLSEKQTGIAKGLTKIGYDLVVGSHSHVIQKFKLVNGKPVVFSLGNLISHLNVTGKKDVEYTVLCHLTLKREDGKIVPQVGFVPCKVVKNYKEIPYTVIPVTEALDLTEKRLKKLSKTVETTLKRLECKTSRISTNFPVDPQEVDALGDMEETLPCRTERLVKKENVERKTEEVIAPAKHFWDKFTYQVQNNCLYKIFSDHAELVEMGNNASVVNLPAKVENVALKDAYGNGKPNDNTRCLYLGKYVETVHEGAFQNYTEVESVRLYNRITTIEARAFAGCSKMTGVILPMSTKTLGSEAFAGCTSLLSVKIPSSVEAIAEDAFKGCDKLTIYCEPDSVADRFAEEKGIPVHYMPLDPNTDPGSIANETVVPAKPAAVETEQPAVVPEDEKNTVVVTMGPMNGPEDKHPVSIIATCHFLGKPLPKSAICGKQPSYYIGEKTFNGKLETIKKLMGDKMPEMEPEKLERAYKLFRNKFKTQQHLTYTTTDMTVYFCDWLLYARDRGFSLNCYFDYELYNKEPDVRDTFLNEGYRQRVYEVCNTPGFRKVYLDKALFNAKFAKFVNRDWIDATKCTFEEFKTFFEKHERFFAKPVRGTGGKGARIIDRRSDTLENIFAIVKNEELIVEEVIEQHSELASFNTSTLNTLRVTTLLCANGESKVMLASGRFGRSGNEVDNFHCGGVTGVIDVDTGVIITEAINRVHARIPEHPDSQKPILGFSYPCWEKVKTAVCEAAKMTPKVRHVGWDVAVTKDGEVEFVEGNSRPNFDVLQVPDQLGRRFCYENDLREIEKLEGINYPKLEPLVIDIMGLELDE